MTTLGDSFDRMPTTDNGDNSAIWGNCLGNGQSSFDGFLTFTDVCGSGQDKGFGSVSQIEMSMPTISMVPMV
jgi:hypothetical protein